MKSHGEARATTVGRTQEYKIWCGIVQRTTNQQAKTYQRYGARGISLCPRWTRYENFIADMDRRPSPTHSIDRMDFNGNYTPENCRWATRQEQSRNRADRRPLTIDGVTKLLCEWAEISGVNIKTIWERIYINNWLPSRAVFTPVRHGRPTHCQNGHEFHQTGRWEGASQRCKLCKKSYDAEYRRS